MTGDQKPLFPDIDQADAVRSGDGRRRSALILPRLLKGEARKIRIADDALLRAHEIVVRWADLETSGRLAKMKETAVHGEFLRDIFGEALGYTFFSQNLPQWHIQAEYTVNGGAADAAIGTFSPDNGDPPRVLVELKGPTVNLDRDRSRGRTPVQQLWDYLNAVPRCPWGVVSNFVSIRLYHRAKTPRSYELFTLQEMRDIKRFREFFYLFERPGLLPEVRGQTPRADRLLEDTDNRQREVGDRLYDAYRQNRQALVHHLHIREKKTLDAAIRIAQKLLDRIVFVAFCEDRGLLPVNVIDQTYEYLPPFSKVTNPRWRNFMDLFRAIDGGHKNLDLSRGYNGGLFRYDPEVDDLQLDDEWTGFFREIGTYDFRDEVNVDVLGHLFEKSVTEIEKMRTGGLFEEEPESGNGAPVAMQKSARRKRFGIYYTPPEFTAFIVNNTIGRLVDARFDALAKTHKVDLHADPDESDADRLRDYWRACLAALRALKVCDPACGSGAFLIKAYDALEPYYQRVIDGLSAAGDGDAESLEADAADMILNDNLFGVDLSPEAVEITQLALWIRTARPGRTLADLSANIVCGNSLIADRSIDEHAIVWEQTFPAVFAGEQRGFDCVIGNPPWERLKLQEREFFSHSAPRIAGAVSAATRRTLIAELESANPELYARYVEAGRQAERVLDYARESKRYPLTGKGDINTYSLFAELARSIVAPHGYVGLLTPSGIASDHTTRAFFDELMTSQSLILLYDFENKKGFFPDVHRSFKFCTLIFGGAEVRTPQADFVFFAHAMEDLEDRKRHIPLTNADMELLNPNTRTCPVFRTRRDAQITRDVYERVPILIDKNRKSGGNPWGIKFMTIFHQTNDAELFHTAEQLQKKSLKLTGNVWKRGKQTWLPLYEAKMVQAYDHRAAGVIVEEANWMRQGQTKPTTLVSHQNPEFVVQPRWWVKRDEVEQAIAGRVQPAYLCYKDVTSPTNERTMIAAFIPLVGVVNSAPLVLTGDQIEPRRTCCLLANLNSFALDFVARQKVGNVHLNFFIVEQLPILPPDVYAERCPWHTRQTLERWISERVLKLTCTADDMRPLAEEAGFKPGVYKWKSQERAELLAELDAAYFRLYGLDRDDLEYVLSTFTGTRRRDQAEIGSFKTAELILAAFDKFADD